MFAFIKMTNPGNGANMLVTPLRERASTNNNESFTTNEDFKSLESASESFKLMSLEDLFSDSTQISLSDNARHHLNLLGGSPSTEQMMYLTPPIVPQRRDPQKPPPSVVRITNKRKRQHNPHPSILKTSTSKRIDFETNTVARVVRFVDSPVSSPSKKPKYSFQENMQ